MTRSSLRAWFEEVIQAYADGGANDYLYPFLASMRIMEDGKMRDRAIEHAFERTVPHDVSDVSTALTKLADFTDVEITTVWKISAGTQISSDLRHAALTPNSAEDPLRKLLERLSSEFSRKL